MMEAPKGVVINAEAGNLEATCRTELKLESKVGEVSRRRLLKVQTKPFTWPSMGLLVAVIVVILCQNTMYIQKHFYYVDQ